MSETAVTQKKKNMDKVYEELDEVKAELEKLRAEYKSKAESSENLRKAHNEQLTKVKEANLKIEKQAQEINENAEKISAAARLCEDLKSSIKDKESILQHVRAANEKLRFDSDEKCQKLEAANRVLALALEEANEKKMKEEQKIRAYKEEIEGLKGSLSISQKKYIEAEEKANASKDIKERDEVICRLEEEDQKVQDQLKWKKEQFRHLEEAHEKLRRQFKESQKEWEMEKSSLLDEICSLQTNLDSQTRISDDLQKRLQMCNQALAHEESRRKRLEVQVSEFQMRFTNSFSDNEDAKSQLECLTTEMDKEIASLRQSISTKATLHKEMEYQTGKLLQENQELRMSLKELQEAQIQAAPGSPSLAKLRNKIKRLEQMHKDSSADHREKEAEWSSQLENVTRDLSNHKSELENKDAALIGLRIELEQMHRDCTLNLRDKEECCCQLEKMREELNFYISELASKDAALKQLKMEMEQMHRNSTTIGAKDAEWISQVEEMRHDLESYVSELERKDATINELKMEIEQMQRNSTTIGAKDAEWISQVEEMRHDLENYISELERKDATINELKMEIEQMRMDYTANRSKDVERSSQLEKMAGDLKHYISKIENKDATIDELKMEMEQMHRDCKTNQAKETEWRCQLEKITGDVKIYKSELEYKDSVINDLKMELEQMHRDCKTNEVKETEWRCQLKKITGDMKIYKSESERKDSVINELKMELEACHVISVQLTLQKEELSILLLVLKLGISEAQLKITNEKSEMFLLDKQKEEHVSRLMQQLEMKNALIMAQTCIEEERNKASSLSRRIDSLDLFEKQQLEQIDRYKELLEESSKHELCLKQQVVQMESGRKRELKEFNEALEIANTELAEKICEESEFEIELHIWKSIAENLRSDLEASLGMRKELEASLLAEVDVGETIKQEKKRLLCILDEKEKAIYDLHQQIELLGQNRLESQQKTMLDSKQQALDVEAEMEAKELEVKKLRDEMMTEMRNSNAIIEELKSERRSMLEEVIKLSSENISEFSSTDEQLMGMLENMVLSFDNQGLGRDLKWDDENPEKENISTPTMMKKSEAISGLRSPFRDLNT